MIHKTSATGARLKSGIKLLQDAVALADLGANDVLVAMTHGGICGSDIHYYQDGGFGSPKQTENRRFIIRSDIAFALIMRLWDQLN
jgi:threonine dehydrogenase-like Zn-dependent dehydrogenase